MLFFTLDGGKTYCNAAVLRRVRETALDVAPDHCYYSVTPAQRDRLLAHLRAGTAGVVDLDRDEPVGPPTLPTEGDLSALYRKELEEMKGYRNRAVDYQNKVMGERDQARLERDTARTAQDRACKERDEALAQLELKASELTEASRGRDRALAELRTASLATWLPSDEDLERWAKEGGNRRDEIYSTARVLGVHEAAHDASTWSQAVDVVRKRRDELLTEREKAAADVPREAVLPHGGADRPGRRRPGKIMETPKAPPDQYQVDFEYLLDDRGRHHVDVLHGQPFLLERKAGPDERGRSIYRVVARFPKLGDAGRKALAEAVRLANSLPDDVGPCREDDCDTNGVYKACGYYLCHYPDDASDDGVLLNCEYLSDPAPLVRFAGLAEAAVRRGKEAAKAPPAPTDEDEQRLRQLAQESIRLRGETSKAYWLGVFAGKTVESKPDAPPKAPPGKKTVKKEKTEAGVTVFGGTGPYFLVRRDDSGPGVVGEESSVWTNAAPVFRTRTRLTDSLRAGLERLVALANASFPDYPPPNDDPDLLKAAAERPYHLVEHFTRLVLAGDETVEVKDWVTYGPACLGKLLARANWQRAREHREFVARLGDGRVVGVNPADGPDKTAVTAVDLTTGARVAWQYGPGSEGLPLPVADRDSLLFNLPQRSATLEAFRQKYQLPPVRWEDRPPLDDKEGGAK